MAKKSTAENPETPEAAEAQGIKVRWNTDNLNSAYANVCNVTSTREEVVLNFGVNKAWERGQQQMEIELSNRIILSPYAAKRLHLMLDKLIKEYEKRYGDLNLEVGDQA
ncbi:MAG TPA: DUF3467 domain-containing protein [Acidiferrobacteraceae bacterium]|nr:DUF3467 domain-containing protein [Acidiferrobacteraceae bacterium]HEX19511.1 DUF3467 domain-containing protein [Acidiferrobacteraceae bacterium]